MANIAEPIRKRKKSRGRKAVGRAEDMDEGLRNDAGIVTNNRARKQKSRLAPAFLFAPKQAEPVRDYDFLGAGFFFAFFAAMVRSPVKVVKNTAINSQKKCMRNVFTIGIDNL
jgi:hypothetical protein